jgi:DNA-binding NarL/FixJ family response regulator
MNEQIPAYVLARSGRMRDGLVALLRAEPRIGAIRQVAGELTELMSVPNHHQALILLDARLMNQELWRYLEQIKENSSHTQCKYIVLADNVFQQRLAKAAGVDKVLLAGFPAAQLFSTIDDLFNQAELQPVETRR